MLRAKLPALLAAEARGDAPLYYTQWRSLLRGLPSLENYRRVYGARLEPNLVIGFLLFDADSPRSLRYGASVVRDYLAALSGPHELTTPARIIGRLAADLRYDDEARCDAATSSGSSTVSSASWPRLTTRSQRSTS